jgi:hypothetical protein
MNTLHPSIAHSEERPETAQRESEERERERERELARETARARENLLGTGLHKGGNLCSNKVQLQNKQNWTSREF